MDAEAKRRGDPPIRWNGLEQEMFLGSLLGAAPGILNGVGNIIGAARGRE